MREAKVTCPKCKYVILVRTESEIVDGIYQDVNCPACKNSFKIRCHKAPEVYDSYEDAKNTQASDPYKDIYNLNKSFYNKLFAMIILLSLGSLLLPIIITIPACIIFDKKGIKKTPITICSFIGLYIWIAIIIFLFIR